MGPRRSGVLRRLRRLLTERPIRLRLAVIYAVLFLVAGAALLALTYGLLAHGLSAGGNALPKDQNALNKLLGYCNALNKTGQQALFAQECSHAYSAGVGAGQAEKVSQALSQLLDYSLLGLGVLTVVSGGLGWLVAGRALRPVAAITDAATRASERHLGERLALRGPKDEITRLADAFDDMLDRLDQAFAGQRRFVANASHELRTPLALMRATVDVTLAKPHRTPQHLEAMAGEISHAVDRAEALIEALLTLARSDHEITTWETVDLATCVEDALDTVGPALRSVGLRVEDTLASAPTCGDRVLLDRMTTNLVDNAVKHNHEGGVISIRTGIDDDHAFLEIVNSGAPVTDTVVPTLFEPFRRGEERTGAGTGLGLSIVASVAAVHHGTVHAEPGPTGGLLVRVDLPTVDHP